MVALSDKPSGRKEVFAGSCFTFFHPNHYLSETQVSHIKNLMKLRILEQDLARGQSRPTNATWERPMDGRPDWRPLQETRAGQFGDVIFFHAILKP